MTRSAASRSGTVPFDAGRISSCSKDIDGPAAMIDRIRWMSRLVLLGAGVASSFLAATAAAAEFGPVTGLPLPRFVSVKANPANVRIGPGIGYPVKWITVRRGLPVEITAEFENWRRIRDWNGDEGWILGGLLSSRRMALVNPWSYAEPVPLYAAASETSRVAAIMHPKVLLSIGECDGRWCEASVKGNDGYVSQVALWGVYPNEVF
jgi:SH3-like domain-containing protein